MAEQPPLRIDVHVLCVHLGFEETYDACVETVGMPKDQRMYRLLTAKGEYLRLSDASGDAPITCDNWHQAMELLKTNGAAFIFNLRECSVLYWHEPQKAWRTAYVYLHPDFDHHYNGLTISKGDTRNEKKPKLTGAQRRKKARAREEERVNEANLVATERRKHRR